MGIRTRSLDFLRENLFGPGYGGSNITQKNGVDMIVAVRDAGTDEFGENLVSLKGYWVGNLSDSWTANDYVTRVMDAFETGKPIPRVNMIQSERLVCDADTKTALLTNCYIDGAMDLPDGSTELLFPVHLAEPKFSSHVPRSDSEEIDDLHFSSGAWLMYSDPVKSLRDFSSDDLMAMVESAQHAEQSLMKSMAQIDAQAKPGLSYEDRVACRSQVLNATNALVRVELAAPENMTDMQHQPEIEAIIDYVRNEDGTYDGHMVPVMTWCGNNEVQDGYLAFANSREMTIGEAERAITEEQAISFLYETMADDLVHSFTNQMRPTYPIERITPVVYPLDDLVQNVSAERVEHFEDGLVRRAWHEGLSTPVERYTDDHGDEHLLAAGVFSGTSVVQMAGERDVSAADLRDIAQVNDDLNESVELRASSYRRSAMHKFAEATQHPAFYDEISGIAPSAVREVHQIASSLSSHPQVCAAMERVADRLQVAGQTAAAEARNHTLASQPAQRGQMVSLDEQGSIERTDEIPSL